MNLQHTIYDKTEVKIIKKIYYKIF